MADRSAPVLAHIHIPKSAGSSLREALDSAFTASAHLQLYFENDTEFVYENSQIEHFITNPAVRAFSSHFVRRFPPQLAKRPVFYITCLRQPVQQFISYLTYTKKHYAAIHDPVLQQHLPPDMENRSLRECARWILAGNPDFFRNFRENYATNFFARYTVLEESGFTYSDARYRDARLGAAREVLSKFLFVGIAEHMDESWRLMRAQAGRFGISMPDLRITHENTSSELRDDLSWVHADDEVGKALLMSIAEDRQLYAWALNRFKQQCQDCKLAA